MKLKTSGNNILISPSIIATDLSTLGSRINEFNPEVIDLLHMDVMDGNFVPNITFGPGYIRDLMSHTEIPFDVHLMIDTPEKSIDSFIELKPWVITIHYETTHFPIRLLKLIRDAGIRAGISLNPGTPVQTLYDIIPYADMVLVMSVDPGFYGQSFLETSYTRIHTLFTHMREQGYSHEPLIQVDGGISLENINNVRKAGAEIFVAGKSAFSGIDVNHNVRELKKQAMRSPETTI